MSQQPLVSLLLQSYNHKPFLDRSVGTALSQIWQEKEVWVVDDGSTDGSHEVLLEWSLRAGFRYDRQKNQGLIPTLNRMVAGSKGKYLALQATDDFWHPDKTRLQVEFLEAHPDVDVCIGSTVCVGADSQPLSGPSQQFLAPSPAGYGFEALFLGQSAVPGASSLIRRAALERVGPFDPAFPIEDLWLWLHLTRAGGKIAFLDQEIAYYRQHGSNLHGRLDFMERETFRILDLHSDHPLYRRALRRWRAAMFSSWSTTNKREALRRLLSVSPREDQARKGILKLLIPGGLWRRWKRI
ncbi:MAG: glycosyltransferase [Fibrobacteres bacterium]|nr:glycosyltransferase [Fibrobacterota bacterium]